MANPELGGGAAGAIGTWQTVNLALPDFLETVRQAVDAFFTALINVLNILLQILEVLKTFAIGFLDPIIALIEALLALIEAILNDLRQAGLYIHGDFYILEGPEFKDLRGGFSAYEKRMISRLVDRRDPNRPNISSLSTVISVFLYLSVDLTAVDRLLALIRGIMNLFNQKIDLKPLLGTPVNVQAKYGLDGASIFSYGTPGVIPTRAFREDQNVNTTVNAVNLTWQMAPAPGNFVTNFAQLPPRGFLVEVSTEASGILVQYDKPTKGANEASPDNKGTDVGTAVDVNGAPIRLYGGIQQLRIADELQWNKATNLTGDRKTLGARVYGVKSLADAAPIQLSDLQQGNDFLLQRTFFVPFGQNLFFPGKGYGVTIPFEDMPKDASWELGVGGDTNVTVGDRPNSFFVRVRAVSRNIESESDWQYQADRVIIDNGTDPVEFPMALGFNFEDVGPSSAPFEVTFPDANTEDYLKCVVQALLLVMLCRADLPVRTREVAGADGAPPTIQTINFPPTDADADANNVLPSRYWSDYVGTARLPTQLEEAGAILMSRLVGRDRRIDKYYNTTENLTKWRKKTARSALNLANDLFVENPPSPTIAQVVVDACQDLLNYTLLDKSLLTLLYSTDLLLGIAPNPEATGAPNITSVTTQTVNPAVLPREPHFFQAPAKGNNLVVAGSVDKSPVLYHRTKSNFDELDFIRNLVPDNVYEQAALALRIAVGPVVRPQEKGWIALRLFPQGLPDVDRFFDELLAILRSIRAALNAITDLIRRFIEFLQSRIIELQALLNRINSMIQNLLRLFVGLPAASGLVTIANGTDGTLQALVSAQNKPFDSPAAYGAGVVLLAGGIPNVALELFKALVQGDG